MRLLLFEECRKCRGEGYLYSDPVLSEKKCSECHGTGKVPNEDGQEILDLLKWSTK